jgi:oxygen-independent coproporphyrinogen-3 oxidase
MEITLEANPETLDEEKLNELAEAGFNRLSLGAQSFDLKALEFLERNHRPKQVEKAGLAARKAGFKNISIDVIIGLPEPHFEVYRADVKRGIWLEPEHISVYLLTAEEPSRLYESVKCGKVTLPDQDAQADCFLECHRLLTEEGFEHYEVSNYGLPGFYSRHNQAYWDGTPYLGLGAGAHSFIRTDEQAVRRANASDPDVYMKHLELGEDPVDFSEIITPMMALSERLMLELRTAKGVKPVDYGEHGEAIKKEVEKLIENGWYEWDGERFRPTAEGYLVADGVAASVLDNIRGQGSGDRGQ